MLRKVTGAMYENNEVKATASGEVFGEEKIILHCSARSCGQDAFHEPVLQEPRRDRARLNAPVRWRKIHRQ
jgi:hypothetical protein